MSREQKSANNSQMVSISKENRTLPVPSSAGSKLVASHCAITFDRPCLCRTYRIELNYDTQKSIK